MTIWRKGMLAVCVDVSDNPFAPSRRGEARRLLKLGAIYRVDAVLPDVGFGPALLIRGNRSTGNRGGWKTWHFRPLIDQADDVELIAKIKACKPARVPVLSDDTAATGRRNEAVANPTSDGLPIPASGGKPHKDGVDQGSNLDSHAQPDTRKG